MEDALAGTCMKKVLKMGGREKEKETLITRDRERVKYRDDFLPVASLKPESGERGEGWCLEGGVL